MGGVFALCGDLFVLARNMLGFPPSFVMELSKTGDFRARADLQK